MANGYHFYESSLSHLVESLIHLPDVPWSQIQRIISLCPRVDTSPCSVSQRQYIAACSAADYFLRAATQHHHKLNVYFLSLLKALPAISWNVSKNQITRNDEYIARSFSYKISSVLLEVNTGPAQLKIVSCLQNVLSRYFDIVLDLEYLTDKDLENDTLLNFTAQSVLGLLEGIRSFVDKPDLNEDSKKSDITPTVTTLVTMVTDILSRVMVADQFIQFSDTWCSVSRSYPPHPAESFPCQLITQLLKLFKSLYTSCAMDEKQKDAIYKLTDHFHNVMYPKLYPKFKQPNLVSRSGSVNKHSVNVLCECLDVVTLLLTESDNVYAHYQTLNTIFNTTVNIKTPDLLRIPLQLACVNNIGLLTQRFSMFVDDAIEIYKHMLFGPSSNLALLQIASCLEPVPRSDTHNTIMGNGRANFERTSFVRRSNRPKPENAYTKNLKVLRSGIIDSLCKVLKFVHQTNPQSCHGFVSSASNKLITMGDEENQMVISTNAVSVLGAIATSITDDETVKMIIQIFQHKLCNPPSHLDTQMIKQLGEIMLFGNESSFTEVLKLFMQISSKACSESKSNKDTAEHHGYRHCSFTVIRTLEHVCAEIQEPQLLQDMLPWLLELFVQRSLEIQKVCERDKSLFKDQAGNLGVLLPVFAILMGRIDKVDHVNIRIQRLFRDFWQICVAMNFVTRGLGQYSEDWYEGVEAVAAKTPLMSSLGADTFLQHDLQYNSALKFDGPIQEGELRQMIIDNLHAPELNNIIYRMSYAQCTFFLSAYYIELMRVRKADYTCYHLFDYLQDKGIQKDKSGFYQCFEYMCSQMLDIHIKDIAKQTRDEKRQRHLESLVQFLLTKFNHCVKKIRLIADKWLSNLIGKFNHLLWSENVLECLSFLTQELVNAAKSTNLEQSTVREIKVPYEPGTMNIAEEAGERVSMLKDFSKRFAGILKESLKFAPIEKMQSLQEYEDKLKGYVKGFDIVLEELSAPSQRQIPADHHHYSASISKANRSKYYGHIEGMKSLVHFQGTQFNFGDMVLQKMDKSLEEWKNKRAGSTETIEECINHTSAFIISEEGIDRKAIRALCWIPVKCFTKESLMIATHCWQWVVSRRPDLEMHMLTEIIAAWKWTVHHRIGLFEPTKTCKRPVVTDGKLQELSSLAPDCEPHRVWIKFLTERFEVIKWKCSKQVDLFTSLFHSTLPLTSHNTSILSNHISAIGPRFDFLHLGLLLLQNDIISNELNQSILRERLYTAILDYFCVTAQWPCYSTAHCLRDVDILNKFWDTLFHDKKYLKSILVPTTISPDSIQLTNGLLAPSMYIDGTNSPSLRSRSLSVERSKANSVGIKKGSKLSVDNGIIRSYSGLEIGKLGKPSVPRSVSNVPVYPLDNRSLPRIAMTAIGDYKSKYHLKKRNLILFLIHHEIERLYTWAKPLADSLPNDEKKTNFVYKNFSEKTWNQYMHLAWTCHPMLTLGLALRVRNSEAIARSIRLFVKGAPANFYNSVEALHFLITPQNVKNDMPQLIHALAWAPASPLEALSYFSKNYEEHPITGMFALQSIQSYSCETLLFLVPQLVQAIRHDRYGYVKKIIEWIANLSPIVTHSIIWNLKTNMYLDEDGTVIDPVIGKTLGEYINDIKRTMSGRYLEFYGREFDFFNSVTEVSSIIKPYPKGPERNRACLKALGNIKIQRYGTYLPSNPDAVIIGIDYNSGRPMQSAAKAPFLATFRVKQCEVTQMESFDLEKADLSVGVSNKSCIFKEGDDLRQDILALQIIDFCHKAFSAVGLDVYLKPYKVVATAPGSGVIEVVPNTKTRDELGKKTDENLYDHFIQCFGDENSVAFQNARENFIKSMAGYSIVTWLLQIKDRHNGNIMIDNEGHIIHIDFGFLFESSPGGNMGFEPDIKLTEEMIQIMGGTIDSAPFKRFIELCTRAFLAVRPYCEAICTLTSLMMETNLPCFLDDALKKMRYRFQPNISDKEAATWVKKMIRDNTLNIRTRAYDVIQYYQNQITH